MAHIGITGYEMPGHYIEVDGPSSESEVLETLHSLIGPVSVAASTGHCPPLLTLKDGRTILFVDVEPAPDQPVMLAIGVLDHDDEARERAAEAIRSALASRTPWRLSCSADGAPGVCWAC
jgi:hypothetical protein